MFLNNRFSSKESACQAICHVHGSEIQGQIVKCSWGRDEAINDQNIRTSYPNDNQYDSVCLKRNCLVSIVFI